MPGTVTAAGNPPLKIAHVVLSLDFGGLERIVLDLVRHGREAGHEVSVICLERPGTLAAQVRESGARVECLGKPPGRRPETVGKIRAALREIRPDVVHTHQIGALYYAGPAARREGVPAVIHTEHINHAAKRTRAGDRLRIRLLWGLAGRHAQRFFCVSDDIARAVTAYGAVPSKKVAVVDNGIDTDAFRPGPDAEEVRRSLGVPEGAAVVGTVGRLSEVKRQDLLIRAFAAVAGTHPGAHLVLVGDGPLMDDLRRLAEATGLAGRVHFAGYQARPERFLQVMDVFALPSRLEGMPLAVLEAWAAGLPVVATRVGGLPKMIDDGVNGLLVDPGDEAALAGALRGLLDDPARARALGDAGRERVRSRFDLRVMASAYERAYREVLAGAGVATA